MLKLLSTPPKAETFIIACSGGVDSMAGADFFLRGGRRFSLAYFHHGTPQADMMMNHVQSWGRDNNVEVEVGHLKSEKQKKCSPEEHWRNERYEWLRSFNKPIVTCHHLGDVIETWIFSALNGTPKLIQSRNGHVYRPFLVNTKEQLHDWCSQRDVKWLDDISNQDTRFPRNRIRHNIVPECLKVNPGLAKVLKKKILLREYEPAKHS